jgi:hypothetical protein
VVVEHDASDRVRNGGQIREELRPVRGVAGDCRPLALVERAGLEEDGLGYQVLAEVVEVGAEFDLVEGKRPGVAEGVGEGPRQCGRRVAVWLDVAVELGLLVAP